MQLERIKVELTAWSSKGWGNTYDSIYEVEERDCVKHRLQKTYRRLNFLQSLNQRSKDT